MAVTADSVVVELLAKTDGYTANINGAANDTANAMSRIERSASKAEAQVVRSAGAMANAQRNLGRQIADIGTQVSGGQSPFLILAQQAPQVADALADTGGKAAQVAAFFAGPWGAALLAAGSVLGVLVSKSLEAGESLDDLVAKLQDSARKTELADQAQRIFAQSLDGAAKAAADLNEQLGKQIQTEEQARVAALRNAEAIRQTTIQNRLRIVSTIALTRALLEQDAARSRQGGERGDLAAGAQGRNQERFNKLKLDEAKATKAVADAQAAVVKASVPIIDGQAAAAADKGAAATDRHAKALGRLRDAYLKAQAAAKNDAQRAAAVRDYREGRTRIDVSLAKEQDAIREANRKPRRGPSAETLAKRAEADRVRDIRNNEAYNNELESLNQAIIQASRAQEVDAGKLAEYSRQEVASALAKRIAQISADESAKKYTKEQAENLRKLAKQSADIQNQNISSEEVRRRTDEQNTVAQTRLNVESEQLQAQLGISESLTERKSLERQLLDIRYKQLKIEQDAILNDTTGRYSDAQRTQAKVTRDALPSLKSAGQTAIDQRYRSPYEQYRRSLSNADDLAASIDRVKIDTLEAVTDELTKATTAALGLKGAFGQVVGELIRIGIQRKIIGPLADSLFGPASGGGSSGNVGSLIASVSQLFGRASGGYMAPGSVARVNEGRGGVELLRMGSQGGTVIPLGATAAQPAGAAGPRYFTIQVDARNSVTPAGFADQLSERILRRAAQMDVDAGKATLKQAPGYVASSQRYGGPKTI